MGNGRAFAIGVLCVVGLFWIIAAPLFGQDRTACDDRLAAAQKELIILKASREQTEASMSAVWARLERSEDDLKKAKAAAPVPEPKKE